VRWDAVVVGAGPAGASFATRLARAGFAVCLVDRARFPRDKACGEFLSPGATPLLDELGVTGAIDAAGARRLDRVRIVADGRPPLELTFPAGDAPAWGYALSRRCLDAILVDAAREAGARVVEETRVGGIRRDAEGRVTGVVGRDPGDEPVALAARLVVGAGGRNDPVARALGLQRRDARRRYDLLAHWTRDSTWPLGPVAPPSGCELHLGTTGYVAAAPVEGGARNLNCVVSQAELRAEPSPDEVYERTLAARPGLGRWTSDARRESGVTASDVTPLLARRATADGALLLGDAALFLDPFTGQGVYLALRSAALAAPVAASALAATTANRPFVDRASLSDYETARRAEFRAKRRVSRAVQTILYRPALARRVLDALDRDLALRDALAAATADVAPAERVWRAGYLARLVGRLAA